MKDIKFARDYGYSPASPFWAVLVEGDGTLRSRHSSKDEAEEAAAITAQENLGQQVHVLAVVASVSTSSEVVGQRYDPARSPPRVENAPEPFPELSPAAVGEEEPI